MSPSPSALEDDEDEDEGHTVVATARGIFNSNGGVLSSIETGVSIIIPQGAIPDGVEQEIYFKVCRDNSILPPLDKEKGKMLKKMEEERKQNVFLFLFWRLFVLLLSISAVHMYRHISILLINALTKGMILSVL